MAYSKTQLEALWFATNPGNGDPHLMAAIALAESSGNSTVVNSIGACGLWQIHPYENGCTNPITNAMMAGQKLRSQGLGAWTTYTNGAYKQFYTGTSITGAGTAQDASFGDPGIHIPVPGIGELPGLPTIPNPLEGDSTGGILGSLGKIPGDFDKIYKLLFTPEGWVKVGKVLIGVFLLLTGVLGMANISTGTVVNVGKKAGEVAVAAAA